MRVAVHHLLLLLLLQYVMVGVVQNGYWKRWQLLKGGNAEGTLEWEETWWEASDWTGLKEMGAKKEGAWTQPDTMTCRG